MCLARRLCRAALPRASEERTPYRTEVRSPAYPNSNQNSAQSPNSASNDFGKPGANANTRPAMGTNGNTNSVGAQSGVSSMAIATYVVRPGDTMYRIARENGIAIADLLAWNNLTDATRLEIGQVLRISALTALPPNAQYPSATVGASANTSTTTVGATGVQTAPVGMPPHVEGKPLNVNNANSVNNASNTSSVQMKTTPKGNKQAYSEGAWTVAQQSEAAVNSVNAAPAVASIPAANPTVPNTGNASNGANDGVIALIWPLLTANPRARIIANFEEVVEGTTVKGLQFSGAAGEPILAAAAGQVVYAGSTRGYGNLVIIKHNANFLSAYAHNRLVLVKENQSITQGQKIAEMGQTDSNRVKLHFEVRRQGKPTDPLKFLP